MNTGPPYASTFLKGIWDGIATHAGVLETAASPEEVATFATGHSERAAKKMKSLKYQANGLLTDVTATKIPVPGPADFDVAGANAQLTAIEQLILQYEAMEAKLSKILNMGDNNTHVNESKEVLDAHKNMRDNLLNVADGRKVRGQVTNTTNDDEICPVHYYELLASYLNDIREVQTDISVQKEAGAIGKLLSKMAVDGYAQRRPTYQQVTTTMAELRKLLA